MLSLPTLFIKLGIIVALCHDYVVMLSALFIPCMPPYIKCYA